MNFLLGLNDVLEMINNGLKGLTAWISEFLYTGIAGLYELFMDMGSMLYVDKFSDIYNKISLIIGVFMVFRTIFWLIEILINPDYMTDKEKAPINIIKKILVSVIMLAITPTLFKYAYDIQYEVVTSNLIAQVISPSGTEVTSAKKAGRLMAANLFNNFYSMNDEEGIDTSASEYTTCSEYAGKDGYYYRHLSGVANDDPNAGKLVNLAGNLCLTYKQNISTSTGTIKANIVNFDGLMAVGVGVFVFWMILMYCISIGSRYIQLIFLQIIAPIPIMAYLTPKKDNMFSKWIKQCTTTYLDLFIRIAIINFSITLISMILGENSILSEISSSANNGLIQIFLVLGLLTFAKKAPDLIQELLPKSVTKASGDFGLSWKKRTDAMVGGKYIYQAPKKALGFAVAGTGAIVKNGIVRGYNAHKYNVRQNEKANEYKNKRIQQLQNAKAKMENSEKYRSLSAEEQQRLSNNMQQRINNMKNRSTHAIRNDLKKQNKNLQYQYANISDSDPNAKEKRAKIMEKITANSDMVGYRNQATTFATSVLSGVATAGSAAIHEDGYRKIIKKARETQVQKITKEQGWFKDNPATFDNAVKRTVSVIQRKYGFETEGQAVQYAIDDLDAGIKKQKEEVTKLQEVEKAYSNNKSSVKAVETEGSGDLAKNKRLRVYDATNNRWNDVVLSTRTNEMKNAIERTKEFYNNMTPTQSTMRVNRNDAEFGMLSTLINTIVNNENPTASSSEIASQKAELENQALSCSSLGEAYNKIITASTQKMNKAEGDYGKQQGAAGLMNLLARNAGVTIDENAYSSTAIENEYNSLIREVNSHPNRYNKEIIEEKVGNNIIRKSIMDVLGEINSTIRDESNFNEKTMREISKKWGQLKDAFEREQAEHARETADANDVLQDAQHEKEAFQRYIENTVNINNDKYGGSGK